VKARRSAERSPSCRRANHPLSVGAGHLANGRNGVG
jgi:hypothetical protein